MRITVVVPSLRGGGAERVTTLLAEAWLDTGHHVCIVTFAATSLDAYRLPAGVERVALELEGESRSAIEAIASNGRRIAALRRLFDAARPDVVIGMMSSCSILARLAAIGSRVPVVACERVYPPTLPLGRAWSLLRRLVYPRTAMVVAQTQKGARWLAEHCRVGRIAVIANPVLWPLPPQGDCSARRGVPAVDRQVILAVGRLERQKGFDLLIDAFARIAPRHPQWDLAIVGQGPEQQGLLDQSRVAGLDHRILLPGHVATIQDWYECAGLFVLSSRFEGFPNALAEAMSYGCAAVSFDCDTGPSELIDNGVNGLLIPLERGAVGLAEAIETLLDDPHRRRQIGACAAAVRERFALPLIASQWEKMLLGLCQPSAQPVSLRSERG